MQPFPIIQPSAKEEESIHWLPLQGSAPNSTIYEPKIRKWTSLTYYTWTKQTFYLGRGISLNLLLDSKFYREKPSSFSLNVPVDLASPPHVTTSFILPFCGVCPLLKHM